MRNGDIIRVDAVSGELSVLVPSDEWQKRRQATRKSQHSAYGMGRELFAHMRQAVSEAEAGATIF